MEDKIKLTKAQLVPENFQYTDCVIEGNQEKGWGVRATEESGLGFAYIYTNDCNLATNIKITDLSEDNDDYDEDADDEVNNNAYLGDFLNEHWCCEDDFIEIHPKNQGVRYAYAGNRYETFFEYGECKCKSENGEKYEVRYYEDECRRYAYVLRTHEMPYEDEYERFNYDEFIGFWSAKGNEYFENFIEENVPDGYVVDNEKKWAFIEENVEHDIHEYVYNGGLLEAYLDFDNYGVEMEETVDNVFCGWGVDDLISEGVYVKSEE